MSRFFSHAIIFAYGPAASAVILLELHSSHIRYQGLEQAFTPGVPLRLLAKPEIAGEWHWHSAPEVKLALAAARQAAERVVVFG